jgi:hypothetical protein
MAWNSSVNGDWSTADFSKAPWVSGVMTLTHEEVLHVIIETQKIIENFKVTSNFSIPDDNTYVVPRYNELDWEKCINGDTYAVIKGYDPEINISGIDANGIVIPNDPPIDEETSGDIEQPLEQGE